MRAPRVENDLEGFGNGVDQDLLPVEDWAAEQPPIIDVTETSELPGESLPGQYGIDRCRVMVRDPRCLHAYWEVKPRTWDKAREDLGEDWEQHRRVLRVHGEPTQYEPGNRGVEFFDLPIEEESGNQYVEVMGQSRAFRIDVGVLTLKGLFLPLASSNTVVPPPNGASADTREEWATSEEIANEEAPHSGDTDASAQDTNDVHATRPGPEGGSFEGAYRDGPRDSRASDQRIDVGDSPGPSSPGSPHWSSFGQDAFQWGPMGGSPSAGGWSGFPALPEQWNQDLSGIGYRHFEQAPVVSAEGNSAEARGAGPDGVSLAFPSAPVLIPGGPGIPPAAPILFAGSPGWSPFATGSWPTPLSGHLSLATAPAGARCEFQTEGTLPEGAQPEGAQPERLPSEAAPLAAAYPPILETAAGPGLFFALKTELVVYGATEPDATVTIQGMPVPLRADGTFSLRIELPDGVHTLRAEARSSDGRRRRCIQPTITRRTSHEGGRAE